MIFKFAGRMTLDNIAECLEASRRFLLIFSSDFSKSVWCNHELALCYSLSMEREMGLVILVHQRDSKIIMTRTMETICKTQVSLKT